MLKKTTRMGNLNQVHHLQTRELLLGKFFILFFSFSLFVEETEGLQNVSSFFINNLSCHNLPAPFLNHIIECNIEDGQLLKRKFFS